MKQFLKGYQLGIIEDILTIQNKIILLNSLTLPSRPYFCIDGMKKLRPSKYENHEETAS